MGRRKKTRAVSSRPLQGYVAGWYDYRSGDICLAYWKDGERITEMIPFQWYFYLSVEDFDKVNCPVFDSMVDDIRPTKDGKFYKIYTSSRWKVRDEVVQWLRSREVEPLEADLPPMNRFLTDNPIQFDEKPRLLFYDLETDPRPGWSDITKMRILSVAYHGHDGKTKCIVADTDDDDGERKLLIKFFRVIAKHDLLIGWNGDFFDEPLMKARCKRLGLYPDWKMVNFLDMMLLFKHPYFGYGRDTEGKGAKISYALGNIAKSLLGMTKIPDVQGHKMHEIWRTDRKKLIRYNKRDVDIMVELEKKFGYIESMTVLSHLCNRFLSSWSLKMGYLNDAFVLRYGTDHGIHFRTKTRTFTSKPWVNDYESMPTPDKIEGAFVMEPKIGLHEGVCLIDFASLYPNIIRSFNISPETKIGKSDKPVAIASDLHCQASNGVIFRTDVEGVFPAIVAISMEERNYYKREEIKLRKAGKEGTVKWRRFKQRSDSYKVLGNGAFGCLGSPFLRYYDPDCAEAITLTGQDIIKLVIERATKDAIDALYADTDGGFMRCNEIKAEKFIHKSAKFIDEWVSQRGGKPGFIRLELEKFYERIFFTAKKRYAGKVKGEPPGKPDVKGLEYIRTDGCKATRDFQKRTIDFVLDSETPTEETAEMIVKKWRDRLFNGEIPVADLVMSQSINKKLGTYKVEPVHVRIAKKMLKEGKEVYEGMKVPYIITGREKNRLEAVHVDDFDGEFDGVAYWKDKIYPATLRILEAVFPMRSWAVLLKYDPSQPTLFDHVPKKVKRKKWRKAHGKKARKSNS